MVRAGMLAGALLLVGTLSAPATSGAQTQDPGVPAKAVDHRVRVAAKKLNVRAGDRARVAGRIAPRTPGARLALQIRRDGRWTTVDRDRTGRYGGYVLRGPVRRTGSYAARVRLAGEAGVKREKRRLGRLNVYRWTHASWYGPGFYGNLTGCGGRLGYSQLGVAHKWLPCGTRVTFRHRGRTVRVPVIDRGPYVSGREYDLTAATARRLGFSGHGAILTTR
jgi:hypothetical protein